MYGATVRDGIQQPSTRPLQLCRSAHHSPHFQSIRRRYGCTCGLRLPTRRCVQAGQELWQERGFDGQDWGKPHHNTNMLGPHHLCEMKSGTRKHEDTEPKPVGNSSTPSGSVPTSPHSTCTSSKSPPCLGPRPCGVGEQSHLLTHVASKGNLAHYSRKSLSA